MKSCFSDLPVKDGKSGTWKLDTFEITTDKALTLALRAECTGNTDEFIPPGRYRRLSNGWDVVMSNTPMEIRTCQDFIERATGHCCKVSDEAAFCLIQRPYISKTLLTRRISPRG
ncbi:hypothetical protein ACRWVE_25665, partial [Escherichia coli]